MTTTGAQPGEGAATYGATRLRSIDALRGAAALAVVLYHAAGQSPHAEAGAAARWLGDAVRAVFAQGYAGVFLFFVISGFCIHLGAARAASAGQTARIEFLPFWRRRLRRLYPAYLVALFLSLAVAYVTGFLPLTRFTAWDVSAHLLMIHNFDPRTAYSINSVFWTLAIEEQLYLAYFLLLHLRRRWGWARTLAFALAVRAAWMFGARALRDATGVDVPVGEAAAVHWFAWALGALAVESVFGLVRLPRWAGDLRVAAAALACAAALDHLRWPEGSSRALQDAAWFVAHPAWGLGFFVLINRAVAAERRRRASRRRAALAVGALAAVGVVSYSLYLTHPLVLLEMWRFSRPDVPPLAVAIFVMTPLSVACAWLFYRVCERPFLARSRPAGPHHARPAHARPAPQLQNLEPKFEELN